MPKKTPESPGLAASGTLPSGEPSPAGKVYQASVTAMLAAEFERRKTLEARGTTLLTSSTSVTAIIFALTVLVTGRDAVLANRWAGYVLIASLAAFVAAAVYGILIQAKLQPYEVANREYLLTLTTEELWSQPADDAVRSDVAQKVRTLGGPNGDGGLRAANDTKARWVDAGVRWQLGAVGLLALAMGLELWTRMHR